MSFKLKVKSNTSAPVSGALDIGELGYNTNADQLFVGNGAGLNATPVIMALEQTNVADVSGVQLDYTNPAAASLARIAWNSVYGTAEIGLLNGVVQQIGEEIFFYGKASAAITNGQGVQFAGVEGDHILIKPSVAAEITANPDLFIGIATQDITLGNFGYITWFGYVHDIDTVANGYTLGAKLYINTNVGAANGSLTMTKPTADLGIIQVAAVVKEETGSANNGTLLVRITQVSRVISEIADLQTALNNKVNIVANHYTNATITMLENFSPQYILLCAGMPYNDVNGQIRIDRTSGNYQAAALDIVVSSNNTNMVGASLVTNQVIQTAYPNEEKYDIVTLTRNSDSSSWVAIRYTGNTYPSTIATFTGYLVSTITGALTVLDSSLVSSVVLFSTNSKVNFAVDNVEIKENVVIHAGNIGSQSVNYAASAGFAGNADLLDGQDGTYYINTSSIAQTKTGNLTVAGLSHSGLTMTTGTNIDQVKSITTSSLSLSGGSWTDIGVAGTYLATGSYILSMTALGEIYTAQFSWYSGATSSSVADEIILHRAGPSGSAARIYLRVLRVSSGTLKMQASASTTVSTSLSLSFRRLI